MNTTKAKEQATPELLSKADKLLKTSGLYICICGSTETLGSCTLASFDNTKEMLDAWEQLKKEGRASNLFEENNFTSETNEVVQIFFDFENQESYPTESKSLNDTLERLGVEGFTIN